MRIDLSAGLPEPLGATWDPQGVNFALRSEVATRVELCLFATEGPERELARFDLPGHTGTVFHGYVSALPAGLLYGYRVHGPWQPEVGQRCHPSKLLLDPYATAVFGEVVWNEATRGVLPSAQKTSLTLDAHDSGPFVPRGVIMDLSFDWEGDRRPDTPWSRSVIYELHVRGFSKLQPRIPEALRGTYAGLAHPASIEHLRGLGVTAVELLPIHEFVDDAFLCARGLRNYWGYSTLAFFAPAQRYAQSGTPGASVVEFKQMVKALHRAGIEVILDVVYNHTCEGDADGPSLSFKGIDNCGYYVVQPDGRYRDVTGCGNTVSGAKPAAAQLTLDSLHYWVEQMHVDGFRFDLAATLGRDQHGEFDAQGALLRQIREDPVLSRCKLIAEPWDLGPGGYRLGAFPAPMSEWNDKYRDAIRRLWRGVETRASELQNRWFGSPDVYAPTRRGPEASINYVTAHDGFTLHDLVAYEQKHNEDNGEHNRDGSDHNESMNYGVEGETERSELIEQREQHKRNLLASLLLSQGVPMLLAGDELGRTQRGNNNAYCQDNELSWLHWELDARKSELLAFCQQLVRLRHRLPLLQEVRFLEDAAGTEGPRLSCLSADGGRLSEHGERALPAAFGFLLTGESSALLVLLNTSAEVRSFALPPCAAGARWQLELDTSLARTTHPSGSADEASVVLSPRSLALFTRAEPGA
ncbi:MAG: glycogen debranching enzyme [Myxococcaceae bacterium]|nr:glycogen debranching enzyme [Myxococcaceae bacterium]